MTQGNDDMRNLLAGLTSFASMINELTASIVTQTGDLLAQTAGHCTGTDLMSLPPEAVDRTTTRYTKLRKQYDETGDLSAIKHFEREILRLLLAAGPKGLCKCAARAKLNPAGDQQPLNTAWDKVQDLLRPPAA